MAEPPAARRAILWLVALGFALRLSIRLYTGAEDFWSNGYTLLFQLAQHIAAGKGFALVDGFPTAFRVPLYPIFLAAVTHGREAFLPVVVAQSLIGSATVWCAALLALEMFGPGASVLAAAVTAVYPYYVVHDTALQDTSLYTLLTLVAVILLKKSQTPLPAVAARNGRFNRAATIGSGVCAGVLLGLDVLTRAALAPFAVGATVLLALVGAGTWRIRLRAAGLCAGALVLTVSPWLVRSYRLTGAPVLTTETGLELWNGNNPLTFSHYPRESSDLSKAAALDALSAAELDHADDRWFWRRGVSYIRNHPWLTMANGFRKIVVAFGFLPSPRRSFWPNLVYALSYAPVMLFGLLGMWRRRARWREDTFVYLALASFCAVTAVFFGHTSHRAYLDVYWIVFAAGLWAAPDRAEPRPERKLLLQCAGAEVRDLNIAGVDWDALADAAEYHGLAPILYRKCLGLVPQNVETRLRDDYRDSARRNVIFTARLLALLDAFEAEGIDVVPLKGPVLSESLYPDPVLRPFSDLDLLVRKRDVPAAAGVLAREGYKLAPHLARLSWPALLRLHFELLFRQERMPQVDLQWETGLPDYPFRFDTEILWRSLGRARISERQVASLSPETAMLFLCVHGAKHLWSRLQWLGDIDRLVRAQPDWTQVLQLAKEAGCVRPVLLGLLLAGDLLEAPVPEGVMKTARADKTVHALARQVANRLDRIPPVEPGGLEITTFNAHMAERAWDKVRHYAGQLKAPTEAELELVNFPEKLFFLYYPLRAARLALKYGAGLVRRL